jgi:hypothetical protein
VSEEYVSYDSFIKNIRRQKGGLNYVNKYKKYVIKNNI